MSIPLSKLGDWNTAYHNAIDIGIDRCMGDTHKAAILELLTHCDLLIEQLKTGLLEQGLSTITPHQLLQAIIQLHSCKARSLRQLKIKYIQLQK